MFNFQAFIRRKWAEYSESSGQRGTVVDELAVKPAGLIMSDFYNMMVEQRKVNNIANWESMTDEELDFFGNKFFFPRIDGDYTFGNVRVWFDEKKNITFTADSRFVSEDGMQYRVTQPGVVSGSSFKKSTDRFALYYVDIQVTAASKGNQFNVVAGKITQLTGINFTYKMVSNLQDFTTGSKYETNEQYYERLLYSISDRSMMNKRSIFAKLPEFFPVVRGMYIAAPGDRYMRRDLVSGIDISVNNQKIDYLGKISGENLIKHSAFYGIYPPESGDVLKEDWGPFSITTEYKYPLTIEPSDTTAVIYSSGQSGDPGFHGCPLNQEFTNDLYKGLYFDDYKTGAEITTSDLFNISDENVGFTDVVAPSPEWVYGAQGRGRGDLGELYDDFKDTDIIAFNNNDITLSTGAKNYINVGKDIEKRIGVKLTGVLTIPAVTDVTAAPAQTNIQFMLGGINSDIADGYTGIGFGIRLTGIYNESTQAHNVIIYMAHGEKYGQAQVFASNYDIIDGGGGGSSDEHISITDLGALAETTWVMQHNTEYEFEFIIHDDLRITLYLNKLGNPHSLEINNTLKWGLPKSALNMYSQQLFNKNTTHYGTTMKIALDAISDDSPTHKWVISDLKAFDTQQSRATALFALNVKDIDDPAILSMRAFGSGSLNGALSDGFITYIWDKEMSSIASGTSELTRGAWSQLPAVSNPNGSKDVISTILTHTIQNIERYQVDSRFGRNIFLLVVASGTTKANSLYAGEIEDDVQSSVRINYIKAEGQSLSFYHANNKSDIYVTTVKNSEELETTSTVLTKTTGENYFEMSLDTDCKMPVEEIISVTIGTTVSEIDSLSDTEYSIVYADSTYTNSSKEIIRIVLDNTDADTITVEYRTYPEIENIQDFFDSTQYEKIYGNILIKHKIPAHLSFTVFFTGNINDDQLIDEIRKYVDDNSDGTFSTREMVSYLYNEGFVNNVREPIEVSYSKTNDEGIVETGTFTDTLTIRDIDYFRIEDLSVSRL